METKLGNEQKYRKPHLSYFQKSKRQFDVRSTSYLKSKKQDSSK